MKRSRLRLLTLLACLPALPCHALVGAFSVASSWRSSALNLIDSRVKATVGPQWIDIEEDAELQVPEENYAAGESVLAEGTLVLPPHAAMTGCLLWNGDTLLMGKLRGHADAEHKFDSLVPARPVSYARDPLLLDMRNDSTYGFKLYPFTPGGSRRLRIRYLLPLTASREIEIKPLMARMVAGSLPAQFTLQVRGSRSDIKLATGDGVWPLSLPADRRMDLASGTGIKLRWGANGNPDGSITARAHVDSGAWQGDYVYFNAKVPDSILTKVGMRSETVVLWRWIKPHTFVSHYDWGTDLSGDGDAAVDQARQLVAIGDQLTDRGDRFGLVADIDPDEALQVYPVADSGTKEYRSLRAFLSGIDRQYIVSRFGQGGRSSAGGDPKALELSRNRLRFRTDLQAAGSLYSKDSSLIRHLLVVTIGPVPDGGNLLEIPDDASLPKAVSVASSNLSTASYTYDYDCYCYRAATTKAASWPGVNLVELAAMRPGTGTLVSQGGVMLPKTRTVLAATLSMEAGSARIARDVAIRKGADGSWRASFNVHAKSLGRSIRWNFWDEKGDTASRIEMTPDWVSIAGDSVLPRLWARSEAPYSTVFATSALAPLFGVVDPRYSLLAMPSDSLGRERQAALKDSGVPFLASRQIFATTGYGSEATGISVRGGASAKRLKLGYDASRRVVSIALEGLEARGVEIRDLRGRMVARFADVAGRKGLEWDLRDLSGAAVAKGMYVVSVRTATSLVSGSVLIH